jgi:hypothetical protein
MGYRNNVPRIPDLYWIDRHKTMEAPVLTVGFSFVWPNKALVVPIKFAPT